MSAGGPGAFFRDDRHAPRGQGDSDVLVFVSSAVAAPLAGRLARFQADLESEGFTVTMEEVSGGTASDLRNRIRSHTGVDGVIMIGWLPAAWYELDEWEWGGAHEEFPLDLYFMDIDGYWGMRTATGYTTPTRATSMPRSGSAA